MVTPTRTASRDRQEHLARGDAGRAHAIRELVGRDGRLERGRVGRVRRARDLARYRAGRRQATGADHAPPAGPAPRGDPPPGDLLFLLSLAHGAIVAPELIIAVAAIAKYSRMAALAASGASVASSAASMDASHASRCGSPMVNGA